MLNKVEFGPEAITYIRSCLSEGDTISTYLLNLPLENGRVATHLPTTISPAASRRFKVGGVTTRSETEPALVAFILAYLRGQRKRYAVFEALERPGDAPLSSSKAQFFIHEDEIYYFLTPQERDPTKVASTVRAARSYPFIGVLTSIPEDEPDIRAGYELTADILERLAMRTEHILIGAYDGEGELIWSKS